MPAMVSVNGSTNKREATLCFQGFWRVIGTHSIHQGVGTLPSSEQTQTRSKTHLSSGLEMRSKNQKKESTLLRSRRRIPIRRQRHAAIDVLSWGLHNLLSEILIGGLGQCLGKY